MNLRQQLPVLSLIFIIAVMGLASVHTLTSIYQDIGRHLTLGRVIWETGSVPTTNLFSYTARDFPFANHHWLAEVLLYWGDRLVGLRWLIAVKAVIVAAAFGLAFAAAWRRRIALPALVPGFVAFLIMTERTDLRPEVLSFLFLGWFLFVLYRAPSMNSEWRIAKFRIRTSSFLLLTLPFVQLLWVNSHIYFFMGPLLFLAFAVQRLVEMNNDKLQMTNDRSSSGIFHLSFETRKLALLGALIGLATLANPHGLSGALAPLTIFGNYGYSVMENKGPFFLAAWGYPRLSSYALYAGIMLTAASFMLNARNFRRNLFGALIAGATAVFALMMVRNFPLFALCMLPVTLKNLDEAGWHRRRTAPLAWASLLLVLFGVTVANGQFFRQAGTPREFGLIVPAGHQEPVDFFRQAGIKGPIFNNFDIGSFLIWKLPEEPVFVDGRPEAYPAGFLQETYIRAQEDPEVWERVVAEYGINAVFWNEYDITPWSERFEKRILADPAWVPVYRANGIFILVRDVPQNRTVIAEYRLNRR